MGPLLDKNHFNALLVEDNVDYQQLSQFALRKLGAKVTLATNGRDAMRLFCKDKFDLILIDYALPGIDGFEVAETILHIDQQAKIFVMSAVSLKIVKAKFNDLAVYDVLQKPLSHLDFEKIENQIR